MRFCVLVWLVVNVLVLNLCLCDVRLLNGVVKNRNMGIVRKNRMSVVFVLLVLSDGVMLSFV